MAVSQEPVLSQEVAVESAVKAVAWKALGVVLPAAFVEQSAWVLPWAIVAWVLEPPPLPLEPSQATLA